MKESDTGTTSRPVITSQTLELFSPEVMDVWYDGVELRNRQLGKGQFSGSLFRTILGSGVIDAGDYNCVPTSGEGAVGKRLFFALVLNRSGQLQLNGEWLGNSCIGVYGDNKELIYRFGDTHTSWLTFQVEPDEFERAGCKITPGHFSIVRTSLLKKSHLVLELQLLLSAMRKNQAEGVVQLDANMAKNHLITLFSSLFSSADEAKKRNKAEYLKMVCPLRDYMEANLDKPITMMDLCRLSGKSESTIRRAFHRIYGIGPRRALTVHRLNATYRKLRQTSPEETTVSTIALRYGFLHFGRFSAAYKEHFNEYPSETLARE